MKRYLRAGWIRGALTSACVALLLMGATGCWLFNVPPTAAFTVSAQTGQAPFTVNFSAALSEDEDGEIVEFKWDFGDGNSGVGETLSHTYTEAGTFTVVLRVTDDRGDSATTSKNLYVTPAEPPGPSASFAVSPTSGTSPLTVNVNASASSYPAGSISQYEWDWGDGASSTGMTASRTYFVTNTTTFTITLTVRATDGKVGTATQTVTVNAAGTTPGPAPAPGAPSARFDITFPDTNDEVAPVRVEFDPEDSEADDGRVIATYTWSFGDGTAANSITPATQNHTFVTSEASKIFSVTLVVIDDSGATGSITKTVRARNYQPVAGFEILDTGQQPPAVGVDPGVAPGAGDWEADDVRIEGLDPNPVRVWIRSEDLSGKDSGNWEYEKDPADPEANASSAEPDDYDDHNFSFDPEGQVWDGDEPAWFPNRSWGIRRLWVNWGDGNSDIVDFEDAADTVASHTYDFVGTVKTYTITVTAEDYLGAQSSFSRTITLAP